MYNLKLTLILLLITLPFFANGQWLDEEINFPISFGIIPKNLKRIVQFQDVNNIRIIEYDEDGLEIFNYAKTLNNYFGEISHRGIFPRITITAKVYKNKRCVQAYELNSQYGFNFYEYEFDTIAGVEKRFQYVKKIPECEFFNPSGFKVINLFGWIDTITSREEIMNLLAFKKLAKGRRILMFTKLYDNANQLIRIKYRRPFSLGEAIFTYDTAGHLISQVRKNNKSKPSFEVYNTYAAGRLIKTIRSTAHFDSLNFEFFEYDKNGLLSTQFIYLNNSQLMGDTLFYDFDKYIFDRDSLGKVINKKCTRLKIDLKSMTIRNEYKVENVDYIRNSDGFVVKETIFYYTGNRISEYGFKYELTFYK